MSQATLTTDLLSMSESYPVQSTPVRLGFAKFLGIRSSLLTLLATGAIVVAGAAGIARISDSVVDSNNRAAAAAAAVPPPAYYEFITQSKLSEANGVQGQPANNPSTDSSAADAAN